MCVLLVWGCTGKSESIFRVGIVTSGDMFVDISRGFTSGMSGLGYEEGKNITYEYLNLDIRPGNGAEATLPDEIEDVDLVFTFPAEAAMLVERSVGKKGLPMVFCLAGIEGNGLVESVRRPGGNITGVRYPGPYLVCKRLEILCELAPHIRRIYIPYDPEYPNNPPALNALKKHASVLGVKLIESPVECVEDIRRDLNKQETPGGPGIDAIQILPEIFTQSDAAWEVLADFAEKHRIPLVGSVLSSVDNGSVFSYCVDFFEVGRLAAPLAAKILNGTDPGEISVVTPETHLRLNYRVITGLGLKADEGLLSMADEIIR